MLVEIFRLWLFAGGQKTHVVKRAAKEAVESDLDDDNGAPELDFQVSPSPKKQKPTGKQHQKRSGKNKAAAAEGIVEVKN